MKLSMLQNALSVLRIKLNLSCLRINKITDVFRLCISHEKKYHFINCNCKYCNPSFYVCILLITIESSFSAFNNGLPHLTLMNL